MVIIGLIVLDNVFFLYMEINVNIIVFVINNYVILWWVVRKVSI